MQLAKILVSADCCGHFEFLLEKIEALKKSNQFDFVLMVGDVFGGKPFPTGIQIHIPIYFVDSGEISKSLAAVYPEGKEVRPNLTFLGRSGVRTINEVKIAYLNGTQNQSISSFYTRDSREYSSNHFTTQDIQNLMVHQDQQIDILITNQWPQDEQRQPPYEAKDSSLYVSLVVEALAPRYHFAGTEGSFYKRNETLNRKKFGTSFVAVAPVTGDTEKKAKYLHAIQIVPFSKLATQIDQKQGLESSPYAKYSSMSPLQPLHTTFSKAPYPQPQAKEQVLTSTSVLYFQNFNQATHISQMEEFLGRWGKIEELKHSQENREHKGCGIVKFSDISTAKECLKDSGKYSLYGNRIRFSVRKGNYLSVEQGCWFCPESRVFDRSLLVKLGRKVYISLDKGPIVDGHFQVVPCSHIQSMVDCEEQTQQQTLSLLRSMESKLHDQNKSLITYTHYLNLQASKNHAAIHCIPVLTSDLPRLSSLFQNKSTRQKLNFIKIPEDELKDYVKGKHFFEIKIGATLYVRTIKDKFFSVDFGRSTLCEILDVPERINWKGCINEDKTEATLTYYTQLLATPST